jgi:hypothetical protein
MHELKSNCAYKNEFLAWIEIALWYAVDYQLESSVGELRNTSVNLIRFQN